MSRKFVFAGLALALVLAPNFASGQATTPGSTQPGRDTNQSRQPAQARPEQGTPGTVQGGQVTPGQAQPGQIQPGQIQPGQIQPGQGRPGQVQQGQPQPGQIQPGQIQPSRGQPGQAQPGQSQPGQANQRPGGRAMGGQNNQALLQHVVLKLTLCNRAEVELGQMASQQTKNEDVKEFAQMMVKEHEQMISELNKVAQRGGGRADSEQEGTDQDGEDRARSSIPNAVSPSGQSQTDQAQSGAGQTGQVTAQGQASAQPGKTTSRPGQGGTAQGAGRAGGAMQGQGGAVIAQLNQICQQAKQNELQMTKEMLSKYEGQDFDMGYLGQQICAHTTMLAELRALRSVGPEEFQQLIKKGEQATQMHLEEATKIAKSLEDKESR